LCARGLRSSSPGAGARPPAESPSDAPAARRGLPGGRAWSERLLRDLRQPLECHGVTHGEIGQDLAVDLDPGPPQAVHQAAVGQVMQPRGRVDARDPEAPEVALFATAVAVGVLLSPLDGLFGGLPELAAPDKVAFGELHDLEARQRLLWREQ